MTEIIGDVYNNDIGYQTCDLYLAAFFITTGCKMSQSQKDNRSRRIYFIFDKNSMMEDLKIKYFAREAKVDALSYADNVKSLKSLCHNILNNPNQ